MATWYDKFKEERILIQKEDNHNKFWAAHWDDNTNLVHVRWGRMGTAGQSQTKPFTNSYEAINFIDNKYREKIRKGYSDRIDGKKVDRQLFEKLTIEAAIVGTQNKCSNMQWVEITNPNTMQHTPISDERLFSPDCNPAILVSLETRKKYDGQNNFKLLFTFDKSYKIDGLRSEVISQQSDLYQLTKKVEEAIGRSLSS